MPDLSEWYHRIVGRQEQAATGEPGVVSVVPDDFVPPELDIISIAETAAAGGAGTRSQLSILLNTADQKIAAEIWDLWVRVSAANNVEIIVASTVAGTQIFNNSSDCGYGRSRIETFTKSDAAAVAANRQLSNIIFCVTAQTYVYVPGRWIIRGGMFRNHIMIRPTVDNVSLGVLARARLLTKRKL